MKFITYFQKQGQLLARFLWLASRDLLAKFWIATPLAVASIST